MTTAALDKSFWTITAQSAREAIRLYFEPLRAFRTWFARRSSRHSQTSDISTLAQSLSELKSQMQFSAWSLEAARLEQHELSESLLKSFALLPSEIVHAVDESVRVQISHFHSEDEQRLQEHRDLWQHVQQLNTLMAELMGALDNARIEQKRLNDELAHVHQAVAANRAIVVESNPILPTSLKRALDSAFTEFADKLRTALSSQKEAASIQGTPYLLNRVYRTSRLMAGLTAPQHYFDLYSSYRNTDPFGFSVAGSTKLHDLPGMAVDPDQIELTSVQPFRDIGGFDMDLLVSQALARAFAEVAKKSTK